MRVRLRPAPDKAELDRLYAVPHDHTRWDDHLIRVNVTTVLARSVLPLGGVVADLSCGDAAIARHLEASHRARLILGDYAPGYDLQGPIEETLERVGAGEADLWVCSETIEHLDDPDAVLGQIRKRTDRLLLSTPEGETDNANPEHLWGWDAQEVERMLEAAGFTPMIHTSLDLRPAGFVYCYGIWACR